VGFRASGSLYGVWCGRLGCVEFAMWVTGFDGACGMGLEDLSVRSGAFVCVEFWGLRGGVWFRVRVVSSLCWSW